MLDVFFNLTGMDFQNFNIDDNLVFCILSLMVFYSVGYMFNFFQTLMERLTAKKGR